MHIYIYMQLHACFQAPVGLRCGNVAIKAAMSDDFERLDARKGVGEVGVCHYEAGTRSELHAGMCLAQDHRVRDGHCVQAEV
jgi:hypothetical protein